MVLTPPPHPHNAHRESEWIRIQTTAAKKTLVLGQIKMATHNLFTLMCKHLNRRLHTEDAEDTLMQLDKVPPHHLTPSPPHTTHPPR